MLWKFSIAGYDTHFADVIGIVVAVGEVRSEQHRGTKKRDIELDNWSYISEYSLLPYLIVLSYG